MALYHKREPYTAGRLDPRPQSNDPAKVKTITGKHQSKVSLSLSLFLYAREEITPTPEDIE